MRTTQGGDKPLPNPEFLETEDVLPTRNFAATRRILWTVLSASILLPLVCLALYGYFDYQRRERDAADVVDRIARVADEQAAKVLDLNRIVTARVVELLDDDDETTIRNHELDVHRQLNVLGGAFPQIAAISVFGSTGKLIGSSRFYPVPDVSIAGREDFVAAKAQIPIAHYSLPVISKASQTDVFTVNVGRETLRKDFLGVVSIAMRRAYFAKFYQELIDGRPTVTVGLYRGDGGILVRTPAAANGILKTAPGTRFTNAMRDNEAEGQMRVISSVDGTERIASFRRVSDYPLYVFAGVSTASIFSDWWHHFQLVCGLTAVPCLAAWLMVIFSLRRLSTEQSAWARWQAEVARRRAAEASSRQLQRMGALGTLVSGVAHDVNNLLMVVAANVEIAERKQYNNLQTEVQALKKAATGATSLARRLLSVVRKQPLKSEVIDLRTWLAAESHVIKTTVGERIVVTTRVADDVWPIRVDATEFESAVINIAMNAREAMPRGGELSVDCQNVSVSVDEPSLSSGNYVLLAISDNGTGMSDAVASRAFEPFFSTKPADSGIGLGLTQVLATAELAGGSATIKSKPGHGTVVSLYLPMHATSDEGPRTREKDVREQAEVTKARDLLLVEDNEEVAAGVAAVLETFGCIVRHEVTADNALRVLRAGHSFDVLLSDIQMPGELNGIDLAETVQKEWPTTKIVLMTGYAAELDRATKAGLIILPKPFDIGELGRIITA